MCECQPRTVRLHKSGRHFTCAYCSRVREHPHFDLHFAINGYAFCGCCDRWMKIEKDTMNRTEEQKEQKAEVKTQTETIRIIKINVSST